MQQRQKEVDQNERRWEDMQHAVERKVEAVKQLIAELEEQI